VSAERPGHVPADPVQGPHPLLVVIDPVARSTDGESVRIAKDVLRAGAPSVKIAFPDSPEELTRAVVNRGRRRPVVVGDDGALLRVVAALHRERVLGQAPLGLVPVGPRSSLPLTRALGVPTAAVPAARAVLDGADRELDLLVDDSGGIVVGALRIPCGAGETAERWWKPLTRNRQHLPHLPLGRHLPHLPVPGRDGYGSQFRRPERHRHGLRQRQRLRIEADGVVLADLDRPVRAVSVRMAQPGTAEVVVEGMDATLLHAVVQEVTVSGRDFHYRADTSVSGPVRTRTWKVSRGAWRLTLPRTSS
jgi:hypothetical protein